MAMVMSVCVIWRRMVNNIVFQYCDGAISTTVIAQFWLHFSLQPSSPHTTHTSAKNVVSGIEKGKEEDQANSKNMVR